MNEKNKPMNDCNKDMQHITRYYKHIRSTYLSTRARCCQNQYSKQNSVKVKKCWPSKQCYNTDCNESYYNRALKATKNMRIPKIHNNQTRTSAMTLTDSKNTEQTNPTLNAYKQWWRNHVRPASKQRTADPFTIKYYV